MEACLVTRAEDAAARRIDRKLDLDELAEAMLYTELKTAMLHKPHSKVSTPGFPVAEMTVVDLVADMFAGTSGESFLQELLCILADTANTETLVAARAKVLIKAMSRHHANFHAEDLAMQLRGQA